MGKVLFCKGEINISRSGKVFFNLYEDIPGVELVVPDRNSDWKEELKKIINAPILYGGSVNSENATGYIQHAKMDGLLIGGASLIPKEFIKIIKNVHG